MNKIPALPEQILPGKWTVEDGGGSVIISRKIMFVPLDSSPYSKAVRIHEYGHIKWSPKSRAVSPKDTVLRDYIYNDLLYDTLNAVEDIRINTLLSKKGLRSEISSIYTSWSINRLKTIKTSYDKLGAVIFLQKLIYFTFTGDIEVFKDENEDIVGFARKIKDMFECHPFPGKYKGTKLITRSILDFFIEIINK